MGGGRTAGSRHEHDPPAASGKAILRELESRAVLENAPYVYGIPLLLPANRTENGRFTFQGITYELPLNEPQRGNHIHGQMFDAPFTVTMQTETNLTAVFENRSERYPFPFRMEISDTLTKNGLQRVLSLQNTGDSPMPYTLAFHTAFSAPESFKAPIGKRFLCNKNYIPTGGMTGLTETEKAYITGYAADPIAISGFYTAAGHTVHLDDVRFSVSDNFDEWILFNAGGGQGFLCAEPQCGEVNGLNRQGGHRVLRPVDTEYFTLKITKEEPK